MSYSTHDEVTFIHGLGTHIPRDKRSSYPFTRLQTLQRYQEALRLRGNWGAIDPAVVRKAVSTEISTEEAK